MAEADESSQCCLLQTSEGKCCLHVFNSSQEIYDTITKKCVRISQPYRLQLLSLTFKYLKNLTSGDTDQSHRTFPNFLRSTRFPTSRLKKIKPGKWRSVCHLLLDDFLLVLLLDSEGTSSRFVRNICEHKPGLQGVTFQKLGVLFISTTVRTINSSHFSSALQGTALRARKTQNLRVA